MRTLTKEDKEKIRHYLSDNYIKKCDPLGIKKAYKQAKAYHPPVRYYNQKKKKKNKNRKIVPQPPIKKGEELELSKTQFAAKLRSNMTPAEHRLWQSVKHLGYSAQQVLYGYIPDFLHPTKKIIIEVDGEYHNEPEQIKYDIFREKVFKDHGYKVLRFTNDRIFHEINLVLKEIRQAAGY